MEKDRHCSGRTLKDLLVGNQSDSALLDARHTEEKISSALRTDEATN
jgi:hypothetical protein